MDVNLAVVGWIVLKVLTYMLTVNNIVNTKIFIIIPVISISEVKMFYSSKSICIYININDCR